MVRSWCVLYILTSKCASRHNGVQFFISHLARWLRTRRFSEPTFRPSGATNHWKNIVFRDFPTFSHTCIFFLLTRLFLFSDLLSSTLLFSLTLPISAFYLSILSEVWLLNFLRLLCTTKLPQSTSQYYFVLRRSTKLAQSTSQYYFVLQSLHKALSSTTLYYKARKKGFPVLPCTTKLAQSTSQYYFALQSSQKQTLDINDMATARNVGTAGWIFFINFAHRLKVHNKMFLVYTKFNALSYGYKFSLFAGGPIAFTWFGALSGHNWTLPY